MQIFGYIGWLLGYILWGAFFIFKNFGIAIIVFSIIVKAALFPFSLKQQKSMAGNARMAKKQKELREKYGNNRQKLQEEMNKLYEKEGVKPMGGCLTTLIPMLILLGIFYAVAYPLTNTLHIDANKVSQALQFANSIPGYTHTVGNATHTRRDGKHQRVCQRLYDLRQRRSAGDSQPVRLLVLVSAVPRPLLRFQRRILVHHAEDQQPESGNAAAGLHESDDLSASAVFRMDRLQRARRDVLLLDHLRAAQPGAVRRDRQGIQPRSSDRKFGSKTRCADV